MADCKSCKNYDPVVYLFYKGSPVTCAICGKGIVSDDENEMIRISGASLVSLVLGTLDLGQVWLAHAKCR